MANTRLTMQDLVNIPEEKKEDESEYITIPKTKENRRARKLNPTQLAYLENSLIKPRLQRICSEDRRGEEILPQVIAKIVSCDEWPHFNNDLEFLWKLYQGGSNIFLIPMNLSIAKWKFILMTSLKNRLLYFTSCLFRNISQNFRLWP